jgi:lactoylglutathione lyase
MGLNERRNAMLKKIERVLIRVKDVTEAADFYADVFGLKPVWRDEQEASAGLLLPETETEIVLSYDPHLPGQVEIHYRVDDVVSAVQKYTEQGCIVVTQPFETQMGKCAVIEDPFGIHLILLDMSKADIELELL